jgi:uracil-DNA glycosylase family 4
MTPDRDCRLCPRLAQLRAENRLQHPDWFNAPVPSFGASSCRLLIVGLAPGLRGANRTGRPFTGDHAGGLLFETLRRFGLAAGDYAAAADDGLALRDCRITNAVRCVPPKNRPIPAEIAACRRFLAAEIAMLPQLRVLVCLGRTAHETVMRALSADKALIAAFAHGATHQPRPGLTVIDSYHCSRQNTSTGRLTTAMFEDVFRRAVLHLDAAARAPDAAAALPGA